MQQFLINQLFFYSSDHTYENDEFKSIKQHSEILGTKPFDIRKYQKISFRKHLRIKKKSYTKYLNSFKTKSKIIQYKEIVI